MYTLTHIYLEDLMILVYREGQSTELKPIKQVVKETYTGQGVYIKNGSCLQFGEEDGHTFWTLDPKMGRIEYKFDGTNLYITKNIVIPIKYVGGLYWCNFGTENALGFSSLEDLIMNYYISEDFTRTKEKDMTYAFGCRKYGDYLELL